MQRATNRLHSQQAAQSGCGGVTQSRCAKERGAVPSGDLMQALRTSGCPRSACVHVARHGRGKARMAWAWAWQGDMSRRFRGQHVASGQVPAMDGGSGRWRALPSGPWLMTSRTPCSCGRDRSLAKHGRKPTWSRSCRVAKPPFDDSHQHNPAAQIAASRADAASWRRFVSHARACADERVSTPGVHVFPI
jgi:hypothetical protein